MVNDPPWGPAYSLEQIVPDEEQAWVVEREWAEMRPETHEMSD